MEIDDALAAGAPVVSGRLEAVDTRRPTQSTVRRRAWWAAVGVAIAAIAIGGLIIAPPGSRPAPITAKIAVPAGSALADPGRLLGPPVVSPGGLAIAVSLQSGTTSRLFVRRLESDRLVQLDGTDGAAYPAWTADGASISFFADDKLKLVPAAGGAPITGGAEVYVGEFPEGRTIRLSRSGGRFPRWRADGAELFFIDASGWLVAADLRAGLEHPAFQRLFLTRLRRGSEGPLYDVTADGQRFIAIASDEAETPDTIDVIFNWPGLLRR